MDTESHDKRSFKKVSDLLISVVVPAYNEEEVLPEFHHRLSKVLKSIPFKYEVIYVNDGSKDDTISVIQELRAKDPAVAIVNLSRNFGKEIALTAGLDFALGDAIIVIDADLQDPPEVIPELVQYWQEGYDVVYGKRISREGETVPKKLTAHLFYRLMQRISRVKIPEDTGDFRLLNRRALDALKKIRERHRFMKGLFAWIGYSQKDVPYHREPRFAGKTKWRYLALWNFALEGITSFTIAPLKLSSYLGFFISLSALLFALFIIYKKIVYGDPVQGYASMMVVILFFNGVVLAVLGIMGEYLGRIFDETKNRPLYFIKEYEASRVRPPGDDHKVVKG